MSKKVLVLSVADKRHMTMVAPYEEFFAKNNIPYDIIRINRYNPTNEVLHYKEGLSEVYEFPFVKSTSNSKISKLIPFLKFRQFAKEIIKNKRYDFYVIWNENTALLFFDLLLRCRNNYCLNVRDVPEIPLTKKIYNILINNSFFTTLPTPAKIFNNDEKIITLYNRDVKILSRMSPKSGFKHKDEKINIVYMGFYAIASRTHERIAKVFANDDRYNLFFYGDGFDSHFKEFIDKENIRNVFVGGAFTYEKTSEYLNEADIINSFYDNFDTNISLKYSAGIKVSYTPMLYIPAFTDDNTSWAGISKNYNFSYVVENNDITNLPDKLYEWYHSLDFDSFKKRCNDFNFIVDESRNKVFTLLSERCIG